jgi:glycosyl transferase family 25
MRLNNIFVTTIERTKNLREENLNNISEFGKKYFDINVNYGGKDGSLIKNDEVQSYINQGIIQSSNGISMPLGKMIYMKQFLKARYMTSSEIGVFLSHLGFWNHIVKNNIECSLILEDDAYFNHESFSSQINSIISDHDRMNFKLVSLFKHDDQKKNKKYGVFDSKYDKIDAKCWGAVAYIVTLDGAKELLRCSVPIKTPVDFSMFGILEKSGGGFIIKESIVSLFDNISSIRDNYNNAIEDTSFKVKLKEIQKPKHIFSINNKEFKHNDYEVRHVYEDFSKVSYEDIMKDIINGVIIPSANCNLCLENKNEIIYSNRLKRNLSCDEISCYMSHYKIWQNIIDEKIPYAIIIGENFTFDKNKFHNEIETISANAPSGFTTISLESIYDDRFYLALNENKNYFLSNLNQHNVYIISLLGAIHFVKNLTTIQETVNLALNIIESDKKSGFIYKTDIIKELPTIIELKTKKDKIKIDHLYYLGHQNPSLNFNIFNLRPYFFKINPDNVCIQNLINMNNGIVHPSFIENGKLMLKQENRPFTSNEISSYLSHVSIWSNIVEKKINAALIINDGVKFVGSDEKVNELIDNIPPRGNFIFFTNGNNKYLKCNEFYYYNNNNDNLLAYIITYKGAKDLLNIHRPIRSSIENLIYTFALANKVGYTSKETFFI